MCSYVINHENLTIGSCRQALLKYLKDSGKIVHQGIAVKYGMEEQEET